MNVVMRVVEVYRNLGEAPSGLQCIGGGVASEHKPILCCTPEGIEQYDADVIMIKSLDHSELRFFGKDAFWQDQKWKIVAYTCTHTNQFTVLHHYFQLQSAK
jgi:hypothetical protein